MVGFFLSNYCSFINNTVNVFLFLIESRGFYKMMMIDDIFNARCSWTLQLPLYLFWTCLCHFRSKLLSCMSVVVVSSCARNMLGPLQPTLLLVDWTFFQWFSVRIWLPSCLKSSAMHISYSELGKFLFNQLNTILISEYCAVPFLSWQCQINITTQGTLFYLSFWISRACERNNDTLKQPPFSLRFCMPINLFI